jgi:hypothetical protein
MTDNIPTDLLPTKVFHQGSDPSLQMSGTGTVTTIPVLPNPLQATMRSQLRQGPQSTTWHTQIQQLTDYGETVARAILNNEANAVSNGSYKNDSGAAGLVLQQGFNKTHYITLTVNLVDCMESSALWKRSPPTMDAHQAL